MSNASATFTPFFAIEPASISFNQSYFREQLQQSTSVTETFRAAIDALDNNLNFRFTQGEGVDKLIIERAHLVDCILHYVWHQFEWIGYISLIAVGGYGRGELHPKSDIDLLILCDKEYKERNAEAIQNFLTLLWDIGLNIGHSVRTLQESIDIAKKDITVVTNLMESRLLQGSQKSLQRLQQAILPDCMWSDADFYRAKIQEQQDRHSRYNDTDYNLEPNVKNAPGSLRDIQIIEWIAKRHFAVASLDELHEKGFFTEMELASLKKAKEFLWKVRYGLHMITNREEDRLLFDHQRELATLFGYKNEIAQLAVEQFMHEYYRSIISIRAINDVMLQFLDEAIINPKGKVQIEPINERFQLRNQFLEVTNEKVFVDTPSALLEVFVLAANNRSILGIRAATIRLIREHRVLIDEDFRNDSNNSKLFMQLLKSPHLLITQIETMKRYGLLGRYLPEFNHLIGQMQHDLFHIYTVDAHTINTMRFMRELMLFGKEKEFPLAARVAKQLPKTELLLIAGLYHDIGKGRGGDHSVLGADDVKVFGERHMLSRREIRLLSWLVRNHLLMSYFSQKRDISDPEVILEFAKKVGDQTYLDYLYVLTVADMNATNPDIWNSWRASLLQQLYRDTRRSLQRGLENPIDREETITETQTAAMELCREKYSYEEQAIWELWQTAGDDYFLREIPEDIAWHTHGILSHNKPDEPLILTTNKSVRETDVATQIFIRTKTHSNVFAAATNALDQLNLNIQDARIYSTVAGHTLDTFYVLDNNGLPLSMDADTVRVIRETLEKELAYSDDYRETIKRRTTRKLKSFTSPTRSSIYNDISNPYTVLEVTSPDRPGLLAKIAGVFLDFEIRLVTAKITTLGERVEDIFFITDNNDERLSDATICDQLQQTICQVLDARA